VDLYLQSPYAFMACCLVKHKDNFTLPLYMKVEINDVCKTVGNAFGIYFSVVNITDDSSPGTTQHMGVTE
jgi:hypothetical protein